jgi:hypothetical protein
MFQIWVGHAPGRAHDTQMNAWLPIALEIANSVTLHSTVPNATARVDGTFSLWPWQMPTGQGLRFDYQVPAGVAPDPGVSTSYAMFMRGARRTEPHDCRSHRHGALRWSGGHAARRQCGRLHRQACGPTVTSSPRSRRAKSVATPVLSWSSQTGRPMRGSNGQVPSLKFRSPCRAN